MKKHIPHRSAFTELNFQAALKEKKDLEGVALKLLLPFLKERKRKNFKAKTSVFAKGKIKILLRLQKVKVFGQAFFKKLVGFQGQSP